MSLSEPTVALWTQKALRNFVVLMSDIAKDRLCNARAAPCPAGQNSGSCVSALLGFGLGLEDKLRERTI